MYTTPALIPLFGPEGSWRAANADLFPSDESLRYHWRRMSSAMVASGAIVKLRGQFQVHDPLALRTAVLAIAQRDAQSAVA